MKQREEHRNFMKLTDLCVMATLLEFFANFKDLPGELLVFKGF